MEDSVTGALEIGGDMRQATGQIGEETVVEPPDPRFGLADHAGVAIRTGHDVELALDVDQPDSGDQVPHQPARNDDVELAGDQVDHQRHLAVQFVAGEREIVAAQQFVGDVEHAFDPDVGEDRARHIADPGHAARLQPQRNAHRPWRRCPAPFRPHIGKAGIVELHLRAGQPIGEIGVAEAAVERPHQPHISAAHIAEQCRRLEQIDPQPHLAIGVSAKIDPATRNDMDRGR